MLSIGQGTCAVHPVNALLADENHMMSWLSLVTIVENKPLSRSADHEVLYGPAQGDRGVVIDREMDRSLIQKVENTCCFFPGL